MRSDGNSNLTHDSTQGCHSVSVFRLNGKSQASSWMGHQSSQRTNMFYLIKLTLTMSWTMSAFAMDNNI